MAYKIQIRRDTATNWTSVNPTLGQGELGYETNSGKLKVGDGAKTWAQLDYFIGENDGSIDLGAVDKHVLPATDNVYDLGSATKQWRELYVSGGSIYVGDVKITNQAGRLIFTQVTNPGQINEAPVPGGTEAFELPMASNTILGGIKVGTNLTVTSDGTLNAQQGDYELPTASNVVKGGVLIGDNLTIDGEGYLSATVPDVSNFITAADIPTNSQLENGTTRINIPAENSNIEIDGNVELYGGLDIHSAGAPLGRNDIVFFNSGAESGRITTQGETGNAIQIQSEVIFEVKVSQNDGQGGVDSALWEFGADGSLTLPTGVTNNGRIINDNGISFKVASSFWTFGTDGTLTVPGHIIPNQNVAHDLGSSSNRFRDLYLSGNTINLGDATISATGSALELPVGTTTGGVSIGTIIILGSVADFTALTAISTETLAVGDSYVVASPAPAHLWTYNGQEFIDLGVFQGPKGELGYTGSIGLSGSTGNVGFTGSKGDAGTSVTIVGSVATAGDLPNPYTGNIGDGYIVQATGNLWVWDDTNWNDVGSVKGPQGDKGFTGSFGFTGSAGADGAIGLTGSTGASGFTGSAGDDGAIGLTGSTGASGFTGSAGADGAIGLTGASGFTGSAGADGAIGLTGASGFTGSAGADGAIGLTGSFGFTGSKGEQGPAGEGSGDVNSINGGYVNNAVIRYDGTSGTNIQNSLVTIADDGAITAPNNTGSMIPFYYATLASFPAATSSHGAVAHAHDTGKLYYAHGAWVELANMSDVTEGPVGFTGSTGSTGANGENGATGFTGSVGADGAMGFTGSAGSAGVNGDQGIAGPAGFTGSQGGRLYKINNPGGAFVYTVDGYTPNYPTLTVIRGELVYFDLQNITGSHPLAFRLTSGNTSAVPGMINNNAAGGQHSTAVPVVYQVPYDAPDQIVYQCVYHSGMIGTINVVDAAGATGFTGSAGSAGADGSTGFTGSVGSNGAMGFTGSTGSTGSTGATGVVGISFSISAPGSTDYIFSGPGIVAGNTNDPVLYLYRGFTYTFVNTTGSSHPFAIRVSNGGANYTPGVSGSQTGTQTFTVPMNAPATLYYQCTLHGGMGNVINIV